MNYVRMGLSITLLMLGLLIVIAQIVATSWYWKEGAEWAVPGLWLGTFIMATGFMSIMTNRSVLQAMVILSTFSGAVMIGILTTTVYKGGLRLDGRYLGTCQLRIFLALMASIVGIGLMYGIHRSRIVSRTTSETSDVTTAAVRETCTSTC